ncbi:MAG: MFS transporter [Chloroflexota bacterium]
MTQPPSAPKTTLRERFAVWNQFNRNIRLILGVTVLLGFTFEGGLFSVLFNLYLIRLGYDTAFIGFINGIGPLAFTLSTFPVGLLSRRWDNKRLFLLGMVVATIGFISIPLMEFLPGQWQQTGLLLGMAVFFAGLSPYFIIMPSFIMSNTNGDVHNQVFALEGAVFALSAFFGSLIAGVLPAMIAPLLGVTLDHPAPFRYPLLFAGLIFVLCVGLITRTTNEVFREEDKAEAAGEETEERKTAVFPKALYGFLIVIILIRFFQTSGYAIVATFYNVYFDTELLVSTSMIGFIAAAGRLLGAGGALLSPWLIRRYSAKTAMIFVGFASAITILPLAWSTFWPVAGLGYMGLLVASRMRFSIFPVYVMNRTPAKFRAWITSIQELIIGGSFTIFSLAGGYLIGWYGYQSIFLLGAILVAIGTCVLWFYRNTAVRKKLAVAD